MNTHTEAVAAQEKSRIAWFLDFTNKHPHGLSGEKHDMISAMLDQGYYNMKAPGAALLTTLGSWGI